MSNTDELLMEVDKAFEELKESLEKILKTLEGRSEWFNFCGYISRKFSDLGKEFWYREKPW